MPTRSFALLLALAAGLPVPAFALGAIANDTTTSMGTPAESPGDAEPRSAVIPGSAANQHALALGENPNVVAACGTFHPKPGCTGLPPVIGGHS